MSYQESHRQYAAAQNALFELEETERQRQNKMLMDAYGDRSNLEELEKAMQLYDSQHKNH